MFAKLIFLGCVALFVYAVLAPFIVVFTTGLEQLAKAFGG